jgi:hypothetical protein
MDALMPVALSALPENGESEIQNVIRQLEANVELQEKNPADRRV